MFIQAYLSCCISFIPVVAMVIILLAIASAPHKVIT